jgi:hypothetical protein
VTIKAVVFDADGMALACIESHSVALLTMFKAIRTEVDELGLGSDCRIIRTRENSRSGRCP